MTKIKKIGSLIGFTMLVGSAITTIPFVSTSCKPKPTTQPIVINNKINDSFLIDEGTPIKVDANPSNRSNTHHNVLLDLKRLAVDSEYTGNEFIIDGEINFGILISPDMNATFKGLNNALMNIQNSEYRHTVYGFVIGVEDVGGEGDVIYNGFLNIDSDIDVVINSVSDNKLAVLDAVGIFASNTSPTSQIINNGNFTISCLAPESNLTKTSAYVVEIANEAQGQLEIDGASNIYCHSNVIDSAGVKITRSTKQSLTVIGGYFNVLCDGDSETFHSQVKAFGVELYSNNDGQIDIDGIFNIESIASVISLAYGVYIADTADNFLAYIDGAFNVKAICCERETQETQSVGVMFDPLEYGIHGKIYIYGVLSISATSSVVSQAWGVRLYLRDISSDNSSGFWGNLTVRAIISVYSNGTSPFHPENYAPDEAYGVSIEGEIHEKSYLDIGGYFSLWGDDSVASLVTGVTLSHIQSNSTQKINGYYAIWGGNYVSGIKFYEQPQNYDYSKPVFYSNKADGGTWGDEDNQYEIWNGLDTQTSDDSTTGDTDFALTNIATNEDSKKSGDWRSANFWITAVEAATTSTNMSYFNDGLSNSITSYINGLPLSSIAKNWLSDILVQLSEL